MVFSCPDNGIIPENIAYLYRILSSRQGLNLLFMEVQIGNDARYAVIGYGSWATAIVGMLTRNRTAVEWYVRNGEVLDGLLNEGRNPKYLYELEFDKDYILRMTSTRSSLLRMW